MILENMGNMILGEMRNVDEFNFLFEGRLSPIDNLYYINRNGMPPTPLKDKTGLIIWAKHRDYIPFIQVRIIGDDGK